MIAAMSAPRVERLTRRLLPGDQQEIVLAPQQVAWVEVAVDEPTLARDRAMEDLDGVKPLPTSARRLAEQRAAGS